MFTFTFSQHQHSLPNRPSLLQYPVPSSEGDSPFLHLISICHLKIPHSPFLLIFPADPHSHFSPSLEPRFSEPRHEYISPTLSVCLSLHRPSTHSHFQHALILTCFHSTPTHKSNTVIKHDASQEEDQHDYRWRRRWRRRRRKIFRLFQHISRQSC
jgi:hypothetical protein